MAQSGSGKRASGKISNNLVAAGSAAVIAVYGAGYVKTKSAADRMEQHVAERRPPARPVSVAGGTAPEAAAEPVRREAPVREAPVEVARVIEPRPVEEKLPSASVEPKAVAAPVKSVEATPAAEPTPTVPPVAVAAPVVAPPPPVVAAAPPPPPPPPPPPAPKWKDGTYTGWGTSRHGDIQAQVVIEDGKIKAATIAQCLTRYSCDVIDKIIPQVAKRQSPETDVVSGATQSSDAFYFGVVEALGKAKADAK